MEDEHVTYAIVPQKRHESDRNQHIQSCVDEEDIHLDSIRFVGRHVATCSLNPSLRLQLGAQQMHDNPDGRLRGVPRHVGEV